MPAHPHAGCAKDCCKNLFLNPDAKRMVVSLGVVDHQNKLSWMFEATPDLPRQMKALKNYANISAQETPNGIFLTHAHIGHYTGLMFLGKESMNTKNLPAFDKSKIYFIHFNHTNPLLNPESEQTQSVLNLGFNIARTNQVIKL